MLKTRGLREADARDVPDPSRAAPKTWTATVLSARLSLPHCLVPGVSVGDVLPIWTGMGSSSTPLIRLRRWRRGESVDRKGSSDGGVPLPVTLFLWLPLFTIQYYNLFPFNVL